ncbi:chorismate-binding protein, partial [Lacticaseibacillus paracasei]
MKGSAPRKPSTEEDEASRIQLANSAKNRSENLMITDLMRHDFSRFCKAGSINVDGLFDVTTHATIHHMASTIRGIIKSGVSVP